MNHKKDITGIILAGGKSRRMGTDKGLILLNNKPFIQYCIDALKPLVSDIIIVSNNPDYNCFGYTRIEDLIKNSGPLAGVYSGLEYSKTTYNLILSCDIPLITTKVLQYLVNAIDKTSEVIQIESNTKKMPLIALYKNSCKLSFCKLLENNEKRLQYAIEQCQLKTITLTNELNIFTSNINSNKDLKAIKNANYN